MDILAIFKESIYYVYFNNLSDDLIQKHIDFIMMSPDYQRIKRFCPRWYEYWLILKLIKVLNALGLSEYFPFDKYPEWNETETYNIDDIVYGSDYQFYKSLIDNNIGLDPVLDGGINWELINLSEVIAPDINTDNVISHVKKDVVGTESREYFEPKKNECVDCDDTPIGYALNELERIEEICKPKVSGGVGTDYGCKRKHSGGCLKDDLKWQR